MNTRFLPILGRAVLAAVIVSMWFQIHNLEKQVNFLTRTSARPQVIPVGQQTPNEVLESHTSVFKLIGSHANAPTEPATPIGVPWNVERAMIGSASEGILPRQKPITPDAQLNAPPAETNSK
jgi:hypothetical protein